MNRFSLLLIVLFSCFFTQTNAQVQLPGQTGTGILPTKKASHIAGIQKNTIIVINGSTYSFTVDTPEYQGSVSTNIGTKGLYTQIRSSDGATQKYQISDAADVKKEEGPLLSGDRLTVISEDGKSKQVYYVLVKELAISGKLELGTEKITIILRSSSVFILLPDSEVRTQRSALQCRQESD